MSRRNDFYFRQPVTEGELDGAFDGLEIAERDMMKDVAFTGIMTGLDVAENSGTPDLTVDIASGVAYSKDGERINVGSNQDLDVSVDENSVSTAVTPSSGNSKVISIFVEFTRSLSDPRTDGNGATVFFLRAESFQFVVRQGGEATTPGGGGESAFISANGPAIDPDLILLCDIIRDDGQTTITNSDIFTFRREEVFQISKTNFSFLEGTVKTIVDALAQEVDDLITAGASTLGYAGGGTWADGTTNPATTVEAQLDKIITDLGGTTGAAKLGHTSSATWHDASGLAATRVDTSIEEIITDLADAAGSDRVGAAANAGSPNALTAGSVQDQLRELQGHINDHENDATAAHAASAISNAPAGNIAATTVQAAIDELDTEKGGLATANTWSNTNVFTGNHSLGNAVDLADPSVIWDTVGEATNALGGEISTLKRGSANVLANAASGAQTLLTVRSNAGIDDDDFGVVFYMVNASIGNAASSESYSEIGMAGWRDNAGTLNVTNATTISTATTGGGITGGNPTIDVNAVSGALQLQTTHTGCPTAQNLDYTWYVVEIKASAF